MSVHDEKPDSEAPDRLRRSMTAGRLGKLSAFLSLLAYFLLDYSSASGTSEAVGQLTGFVACWILPVAGFCLGPRP